ncbi:MAG: XdhC family protein [Actinobacteria bacterium]|nr:MAG: XdhC family protein [Actinomycetota bacterium]
MKDVVHDIDAWGDTRVALATVVDVKRSAPRPPGAKMAISERGEVAGAVSGGCVEGAVVEVAREVLAGAPPRLVRYGIADEEAWDVGLPCGGEIGVWIQADPHREFAELARADGRGALVTDLGSGERWLLTADGGRRELDPEVAAAAEELMCCSSTSRIPRHGWLPSAPSTSPASCVLWHARSVGGRSWSIRAGSSPPRRASRTPRR